MSEELITKRLHVSGLTPAIRPADLSQKLGSFGTVKALDGFDMVDGLGQPRKFGYVTIETTKPKLARCMNILSGVTWKGTKLRIGEAKPDFRERISQEQKAAAEEEPPRKKKRLPRGVQGVHAADMSPVTPENVQDRAGWRVTPLGRIVRPIRMRPDHPLPEQSTSVAKPKAAKKVAGKKPKKVKTPPVRARRRTIDPTKWDSQHLKGVFLDNVVVTSGSTQPHTLAVPDEEYLETDSEASVEEDDAQEAQEVEETAEEVEQHRRSLTPPPRDVRKPAPVLDVPSTAHRSTNETETLSLTQEKNAALGLLESMFGNEDRWGGEESLDSDVDMDAVTEANHRTATGTVDGEDDFEVVPMDVEQEPPAASPAPSESDIEQQPEPVASEPAPSKSTKLKDLFAPREEEAGFSLLGHFDLDLDLDDDVLDASFAPVPAAPAESVQVAAATIIHNPRTQAQVTFDPTLPLFFPLPQDEREGFRGKTRDPFDVAKEKGYDWRTFCRTQTSEEIRQRWEEEKVELTRDWKRRDREAIKSRRRRGGGDE